MGRRSITPPLGGTSSLTLHEHSQKNEEEEDTSASASALEEWKELSMDLSTSAKPIIWRRRRTYT